MFVLAVRDDDCTTCDETQGDRERKSTRTSHRETIHGDALSSLRCHFHPRTWPKKCFRIFLFSFLCLSFVRSLLPCFLSTYNRRKTDRSIKSGERKNGKGGKKEVEKVPDLLVVYARRSRAGLTFYHVALSNRSILINFHASTPNESSIVLEAIGGEVGGGNQGVFLREFHLTKDTGV